MTKKKDSKKNEATRFKPGNQLWRRVDPEKLGRPPKYETPEELWEAITEYFNHCDENPWESSEIKTSTNSESTKENKNEDQREDKKTHWKKVPYTWTGLYIYLSVKDLEHYKPKPSFRKS